MDVVGVLGGSGGEAAEETWLKRFELMWRVEFFGILPLRQVQGQDDSNSLQRQQQQFAGTTATACKDNSNGMAKWLGVGIFQADLHPCWILPYAVSFATARSMFDGECCFGMQDFLSR
jgi:hypothetical protein